MWYDAEYWSGEDQVEGDQPQRDLAQWRPERNREPDGERGAELDGREHERERDDGDPQRGEPGVERGEQQKIGRASCRERVEDEVVQGSLMKRTRSRDNKHGQRRVCG